MKCKSSILLLTILSVSSILISIPVYSGGEGWIRIEPHAFDQPDPIVLPSPATFYVTAVDNKVVNNPQLLLVTSEACLDGLDGNPITISWDWGSDPDVLLYAGDFLEVDPNSDPKWIPPEGHGFGEIYEASCLASHLDSGEDTIFYTYVDMPVDGNQIDGDDEYALTITVPSSDPRVLVYVFGMCTKVPPTRPGFIVPEYTFGTVMAVVSMMAAFMLRSRISFIKK